MYDLLRAAGMDLNLGLQTTAVREFFRYLVSPEASDTQSPLPAPVRPAWMGAVKALFWTVMATAAGVGLTVVCH
jgi:hypothetical protein